MKNMRILSILLVAAMLCVLFAGCGEAKTPAASAPAAAPAAAGDAPAAEPVEEPKNDEPIEISIGTTSGLSCVFDPVQSGACVVPMNSVYDGLWWMDPQTMEPVGCLAESWEYNDDCTELSIHLREGVKFSNGNDLTAEDVLFSWGRYLVYTMLSSSVGMNTVDFDNCEADGLDLTIRFFDPNPSFVRANAGQYFVVILDKEYVEEVGEEEATLYAPIGTGAYVISDMVPDSYVTMTRNENYWGPEPEADSIVFKAYAEETTMMIDYENGDLDVVLNISADNMARVTSGEVAGTAQVVSQHDAVLFSLPCYVEMFDDLAVRQAFAHAVDYESIVDVGFGELGKTMTSVIFDDLPYYKDMSDGGVSAYSYDPELAKQILADAGYAAGDISLRMVIVNFPSNVKIAEALQADLADVGIDLQVEAYDIATAIGYFMAADLDVALGEFSRLCVDPSSIVIAAKSTNSNATLAQLDETVNDLILRGEQCTDEAERAEIYAELQQWFQDNCRWLPVCEKLSCTVYNERFASLPQFHYLFPMYEQATFN